MGPRHHLDRLGPVTIPSNAPVMIAVEPHDLGQNVRVSGVALGPKGRVPLLVARDGHSD